MVEISSFPSADSPLIDGNDSLNLEILAKYKLASTIVNGILSTFFYNLDAMKYAIEEIKKQGNIDHVDNNGEKGKVGIKIFPLCSQIDGKILELSNTIPACRDLKKKGIAFPTCISLNNQLCYYSPVSSDNQMEIKIGDLVKIEMGAHVDGYPILAAHTFVSGIDNYDFISSPSSVIPSIMGIDKEEKANLIRATYKASQLAMKLIKANVDSLTIRQPLRDLAKEYDVEWIEGVMSHNLGHDCLSDSKSIVIHPLEERGKSFQSKRNENAPSWTFQPHEVFVIDVALISNKTGKVKPSSSSSRSTVYIRTSQNYSLKLRTSRTVLATIDSKFPKMAFNLRQLTEASPSTSLAGVRMAIQECEKNHLVTPYEVMEGMAEKEMIARFMFTIYITSNGTPIRLTDDYYGF